MTDIVTDLNLSNYNDDDIIDKANDFFDKVNCLVNPNTSEDYINIFQMVLLYLEKLKGCGKIVWNFLSNHLDKLFDILMNIFICN